MSAQFAHKKNRAGLAEEGEKRITQPRQIIFYKPPKTPSTKKSQNLLDSCLAWEKNAPFFLSLKHSNKT